jgi:signal transduction histidine kinase
MFSSAVLLLALLVAVVAYVLHTARLRAAQRANAAAVKLRDAAQQAEQAAIRQLRLAEHDLRAIGMTLHGQAEHLPGGGQEQAAVVAAAASDLFDMADDLHDQAMQSGTNHVLLDEQVDLTAVVNDAIANVTAAIGPGRRHWRVTKDLSATSLSADRRAMRHVLTRVLANAVRATRHNDWIEIALRPHPDGLALVIEDEGAGIATPEPGSRTARDSRGIGMRLTLARALMEAHGGRVEVEARTGVGTRVSLMFPASRVRQSPIRPSRSYAAPLQEAAAADQ